MQNDIQKLQDKIKGLENKLNPYVKPALATTISNSDITTFNPMTDSFILDQSSVGGGQQ